MNECLSLLPSFVFEFFDSPLSKGLLADGLRYSSTQNIMSDRVRLINKYEGIIYNTIENMIYILLVVYSILQ